MRGLLWHLEEAKFRLHEVYMCLCLQQDDFDAACKDLSASLRKLLLCI